jgi:exodeoxyribonuclease-3
VLCLQETKIVDEKFPFQRLKTIGFEYCEYFGQNAYNGVAILSSYPITDVQKNFPDDKPDAQPRLIAGTVNGIRIVNVYVPHGTRIGAPKFEFKLDWVGRLRRYFDSNYSVDDNVLLCGDLNICPHELDLWNLSAWKNKLFFTKPERQAIHELKRWGFIDVFRQIQPDERAYSWWDHFLHSVEMDKGLRLDHIWTSPPLAERCLDCWIDKTPRYLEHASDHAPVIAEFQI